MLNGPRGGSHENGRAPLFLVDSKSLGATLKAIGKRARAYVEAQGFKADPHAFCLYPDSSGQIGGALYGLPTQGSAHEVAFDLGALSSRLPPERFALKSALKEPELFAIAWGLHRYRYGKASEGPEASLTVAQEVDLDQVEAIVKAVNFGRTLVCRPANQLGVEELCACAEDMASRFGANLDLIRSTRLAEGFPLVHAVGRGSERPPAVVDMTWGDPSDRQVTLIGKGVVFDSGGLDLKPSSAMRLMKKDMAGAAAVLSLAQLVMERKLPVALRVLIGAAENVIGGRSMRPGDVYVSRSGLSVEVGNTDAEGRLILADLLAFAGEREEALLLDLATLTGAARVALGAEVTPFFTPNEALAKALFSSGEKAVDPLWRLPLWDGYTADLKSSCADLVNVTKHGFGGAITAALFLQQFVSRPSRWVHFDLFGWNHKARPGRPEGGEVQVVRALYTFLRALEALPEKRRHALWGRRAKAGGMTARRV